MTELVVIVALKTEQRFYPVEQRQFGIRVMAADHQNDAVRQDKHIKQRGQSE
jgi:hypothetical protein